MHGMTQNWPFRHMTNSHLNTLSILSSPTSLALPLTPCHPFSFSLCLIFSPPRPSLSPHPISPADDTHIAQPPLANAARACRIKKNLSFHITHIVHRTLQTWAVSLFGRTITIHRIDQASFRTFPYVSGCLISPTLHSTASYFALVLYHRTLPHLHHTCRLPARCRAPYYDSVKSHFKFCHRSHYHSRCMGLSPAEPHSPSLFIISLLPLLASLVEYLSLSISCRKTPLPGIMECRQSRPICHNQRD